MVATSVIRRILPPILLHHLQKRGRPSLHAPDGRVAHLQPPSHSCFLSQAGVNTKTLRGLTESLISCPQKRGRIDKDRGYQVCVGQTDAEAVQTTSFNH